MGWDTYFALGGRITEANVLRQASQVKTLGLERLGYRYIWLDVGWWHGTRAANGEITVSPTQWPHGLPWLTRTLHAAGFLVGLYTDAGPDGCGGAGEGSFGHYQQDVNTFASWGFDAVKVDFCGGSERGLDPAGLHGLSPGDRRQLAAAGRCSSRSATSCSPNSSPKGGPNWPARPSPHSPSARPSATAGAPTPTSGCPATCPSAGSFATSTPTPRTRRRRGRGTGTTPTTSAPGGDVGTQFRSQLEHVGDPRGAADGQRRPDEDQPDEPLLPENQEVLAVDQDPAGIQGTLVASSGNGEVWVKPLADGSRAVALLNRGSSPMRISTGAAAVGHGPSRSFSWRDLWTRRNISSLRLDLRDGASPAARSCCASARADVEGGRPSTTRSEPVLAAVTSPTSLICPFDTIDRHRRAVGHRSVQEMG